MFWKSIEIKVKLLRLINETEDEIIPGKVHAYLIPFKPKILIGGS
jgi:hypothetical protein